MCICAIDRMCKTLSSIPQLMRSALDDLSKAELKRFKTILKERSAIPWGKLEEADTDEIVEQMVQKHCVEDSPKVMLTILREMDKNQLATDIERKLGKGIYLTKQVHIVASIVISHSPPSPSLIENHTWRSRYHMQYIQPC